MRILIKACVTCFYYWFNVKDSVLNPILIGTLDGRRIGFAPSLLLLYTILLHFATRFEITSQTQCTLFFTMFYFILTLVIA